MTGTVEGYYPAWRSVTSDVLQRSVVCDIFSISDFYKNEVGPIHKLADDPKIGGIVPSKTVVKGYSIF